ncbi:MAG: GNAT family N-acetyltransferase, partial [Bacteroidota bacterium]
LMKPTDIDDAAFIFELFNAPKWIKYIGDRNIASVEQARDYIVERMTPQLERLGYSSYTLIKNDDQQKIGVCGLYDREGLDGIDLGFALLPRYEQHGFAFEASQKLIAAAFKEFGMDRLLAITMRENVASQKLLDKLGFRQVSSKRLVEDQEELLVYELKSST